MVAGEFGLTVAALKPSCSPGGANLRGTSRVSEFVLRVPRRSIAIAGNASPEEAGFSILEIAVFDRSSLALVSSKATKTLMVLSFRKSLICMLRMSNYLH